MYLTIEELRAQIQLAKKQLITSAEVWLNSEELIPEQGRENWLAALNAPDSESLQIELQERDLPLVRQDYIVRPDGGLESSQDSTQSVITALLRSSEQPQPATRSVYVPLLQDEGITILTKLCHITTLMEQLHQMEDCLDPIKPLVHFKALELAQAMAIGINSEWRFVDQGVQTVNSYHQRLELAQAQLEEAQKVNLSALGLFAGQISFKASQFTQTLKFFALSLNEAFSLEKDNRAWIIRKLTAYRPWHGMIHNLAVTLFGHENVNHSIEGTLAVQESRLNALNVLLNQHLREPLLKLEARYHQFSQSTTNELKTVQFKLNAMRNKLNMIEALGLKRLFALHMPTLVLGPHGFFQRIHALATAVPEVRNLSWEPEEAPSVGFSPDGR